MVAEPALTALTRRSRLGGLLSLIGAGIVFAALGVSFKELRDLETRKAALSNDVNALIRQKQDLARQVDTQKTMLNQQQDLIVGAQLKIAAGQTPAAAAILSTAADVAPTPLVKRVYFQARASDQISIFKRCSQVLLEKGYRVPKLEMVPNVGPQKSSVRYFRPSEEAEALQVAKDLGGCAGTEFSVSRIAGYENSAVVKPHQFEVWFALGLRDTTS
jgi:hypothetical protein